MCACMRVCAYVSVCLHTNTFTCHDSSSSVFSQSTQNNPALHVSPCNGLLILKPLELDPSTSLLAVAISQWIPFAFGSSLAVFWLRIIFRFGKKLTGPIVFLFSPHPAHNTCCYWIASGLAGVWKWTNPIFLPCCASNWTIRPYWFPWSQS